MAQITEKRLRSIVAKLFRFDNQAVNTLFSLRRIATRLS